MPKHPCMPNRSATSTALTNASALLGVLACALVWTSFGTLSGCVASPATGKKHLNLLSDSEERRLGEKLAPDILKQYGGQLPSESIVTYVRTLGRQLVKICERPDLDWEFHVVNSPVINAFALPGGKIFITRGLLEKLTNEAQLAGVLGHEIGHVTDQHAGHQISKALLVDGAIRIGSAVAGDHSSEVSTIGGIGGQGFLLTFSRQQEHTADELGLRYITSLGFNPMGQIQVMKILKKATEKDEPLEILEIMATHPYPDKRIRHLKEYIALIFPEHAKPGRYQFGEDRFRQNALEPLSTLPPPPEPEKQSKPK